MSNEGKLNPLHLVKEKTLTELWGWMDDGSWTQKASNLSVKAGTTGAGRSADLIPWVRWTTDKRVSTGRLAVQLLPDLGSVKQKSELDGEDKPVYKNFPRPAVKVFPEVPLFHCKTFPETERCHADIDRQYRSQKSPWNRELVRRFCAQNSVCTRFTWHSVSKPGTDL